MYSEVEYAKSYARAIKTAEQNNIPSRQIPLFHHGLFASLSVLTVYWGLALPESLCAFDFAVLGKPPFHHVSFAHSIYPVPTINHIVSFPHLGFIHWIWHHFIDSSRLN